MKLFTATWCMPCQEVKRQLSAIGVELDTEELLDVDEEREAMLTAGVRSVPTLVLEDGTFVTGPTNIVERIKSIKVGR